MEQASKRHARSLLLEAQHQLRQPLNAISLLIGELRHGSSGRARDAVVADMRYALELSNAWLNSLTELEKAERGLLQPALQDVPLQQVFDRLQEEFATRFAHLELGFRVVPTAAVVRADPVLLGRQIAVLLDNAAKFTLEGRVLLGCRRSGERLRVEVWDSGPGVPPEETERLFDPFVRLENEVRARERGLGLGLTYASRLAELAGDALTARSRPGRGTCFALTLRRVHANKTADPATAALDSANPLKGRRVLVLEDGAAAQLLADLAAWEAAASLLPESALAAALGRADADLVIADERTFEACDGWALWGRHGSPPALVLLTERSPEGAAGSRTLTDRVHYLQRPIRPARLRSLCHYALSQH